MRSLVGGLCVLIAGASWGPAQAQDSAFSYQGILKVDGAGAGGTYDFQFTLHDAAQGGTAIGGSLIREAVAVSNGVFMATLDFGAGAFSGSPRWLEIAVRRRDEAKFSRLEPRQPIGSTPQAIFAATAGTVTGIISPAQLPTGVVTNNQTGLALRGVFSGDGSGLERLRLSGFSTEGPNQLRSVETPGSEQLSLQAAKALDLQAQGTASLTAGGHYLSTIGASSVQEVGQDHRLSVAVDAVADVGRNQSETVANNDTKTVGANHTFSVGNNSSITVGRNLAASVGGDIVMSSIGSLRIEASSVAMQSQKMRLESNGVVGLGTATPQARLHVYGDESPTVLRVQSAGGFGAARLEFASDPLGSGSEWRPGFIQSTDNGGFTGGLAFFVNGSGASNRMGAVETLRLVNGRVGVGTGSPLGRFHSVAAAGNGVQGDSADSAASGVYGENLSGGGYGVAGRASGTGRAVYGENNSAAGYAGYFRGNVHLTGTLTPPSDRNVKHRFENVDVGEVLEKVASLSIQTWAYTNDASSSRHLGPVAQDFKQAFGLGNDDKAIATVDADGVALAAIQGLNQKLEQKEDRLGRLEAENAELKSRLERLEEALRRLAPVP